MEQINNFYSTILKSSHPFLLSIHLGGKAVPLIFYVLGSLFMGFTAQFISVVLLLAFDFYITKNISGRKLVQLRWWYDTTGKQSSSFTFESYKQFSPGPSINPIDSKLFWWSIYLTPIVWIVFGIMCILRLKLFYFLLVSVGICLTGINAYGFRSCDKWEPNANEDSNNSWFQLPTIPGLDNLNALSQVQSFFQSRSG
ncbi:hypothetical protein Kpol_1055p39 [Vanderwaltozyma polyspora DSM 70294]|uniref:Golgi apparatus membrane protein TVP23 n=1 Tax=Vanderwaltozyma polyspora (strain ATCC 22028 / DSM 70294 / BCRC 21397 / CBS 2163 / NBRC 10782 / NRRL Y-8283 / UCD 57-17) TaxID=436907 RepID=TVP23_VANPO|nr:uncharacterized protein Kpol_1055p39 [Vanderwaltozyma polyspora DSM 70294]A7TGB4.1 RecName: Full=Golgi apparatus membrane protein TVP23 [Vanderwaltozyma polyspora DSM 70294]EDO18684.1 hypothetical protein Kpol_1055p39 [Vanderwaltozyma polyspora DSM 70294]